MRSANLSEKNPS